MATSVFLHIGPPKTGTTYLQDLLWSNREGLREQGLLFPGRSPVSQYHAVVELLAHDRTGVGTDRLDQAWLRLLDEVQAWDGPVVISHENFAGAGVSMVERVRSDLAGTRLQVVTTVRAPHVVAPAAWQERLKNRGHQSWGEFITELDRHPRSGFWHQHGGVALRRWTRGLDPADVHVVTVPPSGSSPTLLWERFATVLGVAPDVIDASVQRRNTFVGVEGAAYLRRINSELSDDVDWATYRIGVKHALAGVLSERDERIPVRVGAVDRAMLDDRARRFAQQIRKAGFHIVGDLADLTPSDVTDTPQHVDNEPPGDALEQVAHDAVIGLIDVIAQLQGERQELADHFESELAATQQELHEARAALHEATDRRRSPLRIAAGRMAARNRTWRLVRDGVRRRRAVRTTDPDS